MQHAATNAWNTITWVVVVNGHPPCGVDHAKYAKAVTRQTRRGVGDEWLLRIEPAMDTASIHHRRICATSS